MAAWTIYHERIPEIAVAGRPLGRHRKWDSRSAAYPYVRSARDLASQLWKRNIGILDQGAVGSCTGNAEEGALGTDPLFPTLPAGTVLGEKGALALYSAAETIDGDGPYPPNDNGSSGQSVCQAALNAKLISGYTHAASVTDMADALQSGPVIIGINWYDSFDNPAGDGSVAISAGAQVRGGHEVLVRGVDPAAQIFRADNSWGTSWGVAGSFQFSYGTMNRLFSEGGDCTVNVPLSQPAPVPVPVTDPDAALWAAVKGWTGLHHVGSNAAAAKDLRVWAKARGYS